MSQPLPIEKTISNRFDDLFLDLRKTQQDMLNQGKPTLSKIEIEQSMTSRSLLRVEKQAIQEKDLNSKSEESFVSSIAEQVNTEVEKQLIESLKDTENLYNKVSGFDKDIPKLLDKVGVKAATISSIEPLASDIPWFFNDLLKMVNQPKYQRVDSKGRVVIVDNLRGGLGFFGLENLILVVASLAFKRTLPQITDPYPKIKTRIWEEALATAISCKKIASLVDVNPNHAFCLGMFQQLGKIVITKLYFRTFDNVQKQALQETEIALKHEEHSALLKIKPSGDFLNQLIASYALDISSQMIQRMDMKRVFIANAMQEVSENVATNDMSPLARVVKQGHAYAQYRILKGYKLIDMQQSKDFIRTLHMPKGSLESLKTTDLRTLNIVTDI